MKKLLSILLVLALMGAFFAHAQEAPSNPDAMEMNQSQPSEKPEGEMPGEPPEGMMMGNGETPPEKPEGEMADGQPGKMPGGMPGGMQQGAPESYAAVHTADADTEFTGTLLSEGTDENVIHVQSGTAAVKDAEIIRDSEDSSGGDAASFYGVGAAVLATGAALKFRTAKSAPMRRAARACLPMATV